MNRVGNNNLGSTSSDEEEDDEAKELTEELEKNFFKTLSYLKKDDPKIYDESVRFFDPSCAQKFSAKSNYNKTKKSNPLFIEEYKRKILLEKGPEFDDNKDGISSGHKNNLRASSPTYVEEQKAIKESFKDALNNSDDDEDILKPCVKSKEQLEKEEKDYLEWLKGNKDELEDEETKKELQPLHDYWNNPNLEEGEQFLCDYILNKRFLEKTNENFEDDEMQFSEEDEMLEKHEEFEHKYNFRYEEPDKEFIKTYPRTMESSLRRKEEKRKLKREELAQRKKEEYEKRSLEIKKLKKIKKQEIIERIKKIQEITGNKSIGFENTDLEKEFNPSEYDQKMQQLFDEEFYDQMDGDEKPVFDEDEDEFIMDCEYDPSLDKRNKKKTRAAKRKEKKKTIVEEVEDKDNNFISKKQIPKYDPSMGSFEKYIDEYYSLECEDIVSGVPTRYSYNKVIPNDYGLTIEEILLADDKELNKWYPIGKLSKIQPEAVQKFEAKIYKRKANDIELKQKLLSSLFKKENELLENENQKSKNKKTKKKIKKSLKTNVFKVNTDTSNKQNNNQILQNKTEISSNNNCQTKETLKNVVVSENVTLSNNNNINIRNNKFKTKDLKKKNMSINKNKGVKRKLEPTLNSFNKKKKTHNKQYNEKEPSVLESLTDDRLKAYGINPKKFRNKLKYSNK
ncbi:protein KRI1 homolog [Daktulosphaira vitifoliae]|uniref:protein KRI1 homolog n=1 Tax=Daktulosphaira vitifoliae TaxID=58002 RepID=UPI0021A99170|nr:protein KRI1 homolog [Daktulosphaira vitifoliae]